MRLAYLIIAHQLPEQLAQLLYCIQHPENIYLVVPDSKGLSGSESTLQAVARRHSNVFIAPPRNMRWASWSIMQARLDGMRQLLERPEHWDVLVNLSGQDFPLMPQSQIKDFFSKHPGNNFLDIHDPETTWNDPYARIQRIRLELPFLKNGWNVPRLRINRWKDNLGKARYVGGRPYTALTRQFTQHLLQSPQLPLWIKTLCHGYRPDEVLIHSFIMNSPYADTVKNEFLHEEDWQAGGSHPKIFTLADRKRLERSSKLFARKFDSRLDSEILNVLQRQIMGS
ncbi:MAG: beta-1,6-N-acetylglucosaminyltransferase [Lautropia sp.]|nr:beta-1,6-N-acetylglucosaminyltransferase [Lautropia sp.]